MRIVHPFSQLTSFRDNPSWELWRLQMVTVQSFSAPISYVLIFSVYVCNARFSGVTFLLPELHWSIGAYYSACGSQENSCHFLVLRIAVAVYKVDFAGSRIL
jgi:hypothetical protein